MSNYSIEFRESQISFSWAITVLWSEITCSEHSKYIFEKVGDPHTVILSPQFTGLWKAEVLCRICV